MVSRGGWQKKDEAMESYETNRMICNLINILAHNILLACQILFVKGVKMTNLSQHNNGSTVIAEDTEVYLDRDSVNKSQGRISASASRKNRSLSPVRQKKILNVKQKIAEGTYDVEEQLDVALDRLLEKIIG